MKRLRDKKKGAAPSTLTADEEWGQVVLQNGRPEEEDELPKERPRTGPDGEPRKFRGIPEDVKLFEVFWQQVVQLIKVSTWFFLFLPCLIADKIFTKARPDLTIQDITALLVSLANLSLSCYPDQLIYVDQVLSFALQKITDYADNPDLLNPTTISNLLALLLAPAQAYPTVLTLLALPSYESLLLSQPFATRKSIAHAVVASVLKNETVIDDADDVKGLLDLCHVLVRDQKDRPMMAGGGGGGGGQGRQRGQPYDVDEMAEEQGWIARMVHLLKADDLDVQFKVCSFLHARLSDCRSRWANFGSISHPVATTNSAQRVYGRWRPNSLDIPSAHRSSNQTGSSLQILRSLHLPRHMGTLAIDSL